MPVTSSHTIQLEVRTFLIDFVVRGEHTGGRLCRPHARHAVVEHLHGGAATSQFEGDGRTNHAAADDKNVGRGSHAPILAPLASARTHRVPRGSPLTRELAANFH